nr:MAG TPA: hypothetical protein [Caudoviricetes sp.]
MAVDTQQVINRAVKQCRHSFKYIGRNSRTVDILDVSSLRHPKLLGKLIFCHAKSSTLSFNVHSHILSPPVKIRVARFHEYMIIDFLDFVNPFQEEKFEQFDFLC